MSIGLSLPRSVTAFFGQHQTKLGARRFSYRLVDPTESTWHVTAPDVVLGSPPGELMKIKDRNSTQNKANTLKPSSNNLCLPV